MKTIFNEYFVYSFIILCVAGIVYWLRIFCFKKSSTNKSDSTQAEFTYSLYFSHAAKTVYIYKDDQAIPNINELERIDRFTSEDQYIRRGMNKAIYHAKMIGGYRIEVMFEVIK